MTKKRTWTEEQKMAILKEASEKGVSVTCRKHGLYAATFYSWKDKYARGGKEGLKPQYVKRQAKELRQVVKENCLLKKLLAEKEMELAMAKELLKKNRQQKRS